MVEIGILGRGMIAPDRHATDACRVAGGFLRELRHGAIVIEPRHRGEIARLEAGRVTLCDERISVGRVTHDKHLHVAIGDRVERLTLGREDLSVRHEQILALHPRAARARADQHGDVAAPKRYLGVVGCDDRFDCRECTVLDFHHHALQRAERRGDLEQMQVHGLIGSQHLAGRNAKCECIADLAGSAGDGNGDRLLHSRLQIEQLRRRCRKGAQILEPLA